MTQMNAPMTALEEDMQRAHYYALGALHPYNLQDYDTLYTLATGFAYHYTRDISRGLATAWNTYVADLTAWRLSKDETDGDPAYSRELARPSKNRHVRLGDKSNWYSPETNQLVKSRAFFQARQEAQRDRTLATLRQAFLSDQVAPDLLGVYLAVASAVIDLAQDRVRHEYGGF